MSRCAAFLLTCAVASALVPGCRADTTGLATLTVPELVALLEHESDVVPIDANNAKTRGRYGTIPGALLLSNYRDYEPATELPGDRTSRLVFYCHSARCGAAVEAARKAVAAGYADVAVLPDGIKGWSDSGRPVEMPAEG
jgi:rhodanese-related sulfurtransferase